MGMPMTQNREQAAGDVLRWSKGAGMLGVLPLAAVIAVVAASFRTDDPARPDSMVAAVEPVDPATTGSAMVVPAVAVDGTTKVSVLTVSSPPIDKAAPTILQVGSVADLAAKFAAMNYDVDMVRREGAPVPRFFLASFPRDIASLPTVEERKVLFLSTMLPLVLAVNEDLMRDRQRLLSLRDKVADGGALSGDDLEWLAGLAKTYEVGRIDIEALLLRVDIVPVSMALAQSAVESGWGTSRFALEGNAVFGQITFGPSGIVPENRKPGETHMFASFDRLEDGVRSYMRNLNSHRAYAAFRRMRAEQRAAGKAPNGHKLMGTLLRYSELGQYYVDYVRQVLRSNGLDRLERARLDGSGTAIVATI